MSSQTIMQSLQVYGIAFVISMIVAVLIKILVTLTGRVNRPVAAVKAPPAASPVVVLGVAPEVVAAISAALAVITGPHRILHIAESKRSWSQEGRSAQHSHQPRH